MARHADRLLDLGELRGVLVEQRAALLGEAGEVRRR